MSNMEEPKSLVMGTKFKMSSEKRKYFSKYKKDWRLSNQDRSSEKYKEYMRNYSRKYQQKIRLLVVEKYGGVCTCCGEIEIKFLSIDHINGGGRKQRKSVGNFYHWVLKQPKSPDLQILCHNCNQAKGLYGQCPHLKVLTK